MIAVAGWRVGYRRMGRRLLIAALLALVAVGAVVALAVAGRLSIGGAGALVAVAIFGLVFAGRRVIQAEKVATCCRLGDEGLDEEAQGEPGDRRHVDYDAIEWCRTGTDPTPPHTPYVRVSVRGEDEEIYVTGDAEGFERFLAALREKAPERFR